MKKKTIEHAASVMKEIKEKVHKDVIKEYRIPNLCNFETGRDTGFAVILTLSTKYEYTDNILEYWKKRLCANHYEISVKRSQLIVAFYVMF